MIKVKTLMSAFMILMSFSAPAAADDVTVNDMWVHAAPPNAKVCAAYLVIANKTGRDITLTSVTSSHFNRIEMHKTEMHEGMMKMIPQRQMKIPAGGALTLEPGGHHLMLIHPVSVPREGEYVDFQFHFDNDKTISVNAPVRKRRSHQDNQRHNKK